MVLTTFSLHIPSFSYPELRLDKVYKTGRKVAKDFKQTMEIVFDEYLPQWNYTAKPQIP